MKLKHIYLLALIPGAILPWVFLAQFFQQAGVSIPLFLQNIFTVNMAAAAASTDLFLTGGVFLIFLFAEGRRLQMKFLWAYIPLGFIIGVCFALPLFLYWRECALEQGRSA